MAKTRFRPQPTAKPDLFPLLEPGDCVFCGKEAHFAIGVRRYYLACETHYWDWFHSGYDASNGSWTGLFMKIKSGYIYPETPH